MRTGKCNFLLTLLQAFSIRYSTGIGYPFRNASGNERRKRQETHVSGESALPRPLVHDGGRLSGQGGRPATRQSGGRHAAAGASALGDATPALRPDGNAGTTGLAGPAGSTHRAAQFRRQRRARHSIRGSIRTAQPLAGKEISLGELVQEVDKITQLYRDKGFPLSFALLQNQTFANGLVVVTVVEGYIANVRIEGDIGNAQDRLEALAAPMQEERPLKQATLERQLNLMRTVPGVKFTPSLDLPRRADGATELVLTASRQPVSLTGGIADLGTGMQPIVNLATNSLTPLGEQVKLTARCPSIPMT